MRVSMELVGATGDVRRRTLLGYEKRADGGWKVLRVFEAPAELSGTSFLAVPRPGEPDQLWVYVPAQRRVRQVPAQLRRERFQGSHFTYEDLTTIFYFDYEAEHRLLDDRPCGALTCRVVESRLAPGRFAYSRLVTWIRPDVHLPDRIEFFTDQLVKVMRVLTVRDIDGVPTIVVMEMESPGEHTRTRIEYSDVRPNAGLADDVFTLEHLAHGR
jgi:hypothetical protein